MNISLSGIVENLIQKRVASGHYQSAEDVIAAALGALENAEKYGDFAPGEIDRLVAEGEASGPALDGKAVFAELRAMHKARAEEIARQARCPAN